MHQFRVTKYDPAYRNELGHYRRDEWTSFSDVGCEANGSVVTLGEYERVELAYIDSALAFMREAGVRRVRRSPRWPGRCPPHRNTAAVSRCRTGG